MSSNSSIDAGRSHEHQFPNEIMDEVVDHLQDNNEALKAISLSSRNLLHRARKHLFAAFVLRAPDRTFTPASSFPSHKIFRLIKSAPHLIPCIQFFEISCPRKTTWLRFDKEFSNALGLFQQTLETGPATCSLRHLYLYNITWSHLSIDIQATIQRLLGFRSLKTVTFHYTSDVPWTVFKDISPNVTSLALKSACFWPRWNMRFGETDDEWCEDDIDSAQADRLRIEALYISDGSDPTIILAHDSVCPINVTHLRRRLQPDYWSWERHQELISHASRSLETLGIRLSSFAAPPLDCHQLDNLKHLHVQASHTCTLQFAFSWLCESLETLPRQHQLQSIVIRCVIGITDYGSQPEVKKGLGWEHIDWFLTQPRFDLLRQIRVCVGLGPGAEHGEILRSALALLPRVMAKGTVVLDNSWTHIHGEFTIFPLWEEDRPPY